MSEKRFLNILFIESIILITLGLCILILPKLTAVSFGVMLSSAFIAYGVYKTIISFILKNYGTGFFCNLLMGIFITTLGILLLLVPNVNLLWLIALIGVYFLLESMFSTAFMAKIKNIFNFWGCKYLTSIALFLIGLIIVLGLPTLSFWLVAVLSGIGFIIKGMGKNTLYLVNKNNYNI